jgi:predicted membrane protein
MAIEPRGFPRGIFLPLFIVVVGVVFLLDQIGVMSADHFFKFFWPAILIYFGLAGLLFREMPGRFWGSLMTLAGVLLLLSEYGYFHLSFAIFWPIAVILCGLWMMGHVLVGSPDLVATGRARWAEAFVSKIRANLGSLDAEIVAVFSTTRRRITAQDYQGGKIVSVFSEVKLDLTSAEMAGDSIEVEATAVFGAIEIRVPDRWIVTVHGAAILGEYADRTNAQPQGSPAKRLTIKGGAVLGTVIIKN